MPFNLQSSSRLRSQVSNCSVMTNETPMSIKSLSKLAGEVIHPQLNDNEFKFCSSYSSLDGKGDFLNKQILIEISKSQSLRIEVSQTKISHIYFINTKVMKEVVFESELINLIESMLRQSYEPRLIAKKILHSCLFDSQGRVRMRLGNQLIGGGCGASVVNKPETVENKQVNKDHIILPIQQQFRSKLDQIREYRAKIIKEKQFEQIKMKLRNIAEVLRFQAEILFISSLKQYKVEIFELIQLYKDYLILRIGSKIDSINKGKNPEEKGKDKKVTKKQLLEQFLGIIKNFSKFLSIDIQLEIDCIYELSSIESYKQLLKLPIETLNEDIFQAFQLEYITSGQLSTDKIDATKRLIQLSKEYSKTNPLMDYLEMRAKIILQKNSKTDNITIFSQLANDDIYSRSQNKCLEVLNRVSNELSIELNEQNPKQLKQLGLSNDVIVNFIKEVTTLCTNNIQAKRERIFKMIESQWLSNLTARFIVLKVILQIFQILLKNKETDHELFEETCIFVFLVEQKHKEEEIKLLIAETSEMKHLLDNRRKDSKLQKLLKEAKGPLAINDMSIIKQIKQRAKIIAFSSQSLILHKVEENLQFQVDNIAGKHLETDIVCSPDTLICQKFILEGDSQVLILGGNFGSGKSIFVKKMFMNFLSLSDKGLESMENQKMFLFLKESSLELSNPCIDNILRKSPYKQSPEQIESIKQLSNQKLIFIDGFIQLRQRQPEIQKLLKSLQQWQNAKIILSTCEQKADLLKINWADIIPENVGFSVIEVFSELQTPQEPTKDSLESVLTRLKLEIGEIRVSKIFSTPTHLYLLERIIKENPNVRITDLTSLLEQFSNIMIQTEISKSTSSNEDPETQKRILNKSFQLLEDIALMVFQKHQHTIPSDDNSVPFSNQLMNEYIVDTYNVFELLRNSAIIKSFVSEDFIFADNNSSVYFSQRVLYEYFLARGLLRDFNDDNLDINKSPHSKLKLFPINTRLIVSNQYLPSEKRIMKMLHNVHFREISAESFKNGKVRRIIEYAQLAKAVGPERTSDFHIGAVNIASSLLLSKKQFPEKIDFKGISLQGAYLCNIKHSNVDLEFANVKDACFYGTRNTGFIDFKFDSKTLFPITSFIPLPGSQSIFTFSSYQFLTKYSRLQSDSTFFSKDSFIQFEQLMDSFSASNNYIYGKNENYLVRINPSNLEYQYFEIKDKMTISCHGCNQNDSVQLIGSQSIEGNELLLVELVENQITIKQRIVLEQTPLLIEFSTLASGISCVGNSEGSINFFMIKNSTVHFLKTIFAGSYSCLKFSPSGKYLSAGKKDGYVYIWQIDDQNEFELIKVYNVHNNTIVNSVHFSPCSSMLACASSDSNISLCDIKNDCKVTDVIQGHQHAIVIGAHFIGDQTQLISCGSDQDYFNVWRYEKSVWEVKQKVTNMSYSTNSLSFSPCGKFLASGSSDRTVKIWDMKGDFLLPVNILKGHSKAVLSVKFSPKGTYLATASNDKKVILWDPKNQFTPLSAFLMEHQDAVNAVAFSPKEDHLASASWDYTFKVWDFIKKTEITVQNSNDPPHSHSIFCIDYSGNGAYLATGSGDCTVKIWSVKEGYTWNHTIESNKGWVYSLAFSRDSTLLITGSKDYNMRVFSVKNKFQLLDSQNRFDAVTNLAISDDQRIIITGDRSCRVSATEGQWIESNYKISSNITEDKRKYTINSIAIFNNIVACGSQQELMIWKMPSEYSIKKGYSEIQEVSKMFFSKSGLFFCMYNSGITKIWDSKNEFAQFAQLNEPDFSTGMITYNSKLLALASFTTNEVKIFDFTKKNIPQIASVEILQNITNFSFSPTGKYIAYAFKDRFVLKQLSESYLKQIEVKIDSSIQSLTFEQYSQFFRSEQNSSFDYLFNVEADNCEEFTLEYTCQVTFSPDEKMIFFRQQDSYSQFDENLIQIYQPYESRDEKQIPLDPLRLIQADDEQGIGRTVPLSLQKWNYIGSDSILSFCGQYIAVSHYDTILIHELSDIKIASISYEDQIEPSEDEEDKEEDIASEQIQEQAHLQEEELKEPEKPKEKKMVQIEIIEFAPLMSPKFTL